MTDSIKSMLTGPWAGLVLAWDQHDELDEPTYREDVARCCRAGMPGVYTGGTSGEFYALDFETFKRVSDITVSVCREHNTPVMIGCSATSTREAKRRAAYARKLNADAIQVALPFWMEVADDQVVPFFSAVSDAAEGLPLSVYETLRSKKALTLAQHEAIRDAIPSYTMVKSNADTIGTTEAGCRALSEFVNVFVSEDLWAKLGPAGAIGCCSAMVYWNPVVVLELWRMLRDRQWAQLAAALEPVEKLHEFLEKTYAHKGFTDTAYDRMGGIASGFLGTSMRCQGPYCSPTQEDVEQLRQWYRDHYPQMIYAGAAHEFA